MNNVYNIIWLDVDEVKYKKKKTNKYRLFRGDDRFDRVCGLKIIVNGHDRASGLRRRLRFNEISFFI